MAVSTGAGKLNDVAVSPDVARFLFACVTLGVCVMAAEENPGARSLQRIRIATSRLLRISDKIEAADGSPLDLVIQELIRIGGI